MGDFGCRTSLLRTKCSALLSISIPMSSLSPPQAQGAANQFEMCLEESIFLLVLSTTTREENKTRSEEGPPKNLQ